MTKDDIMRMAREAGLHSAVLLRIYDDKEAALCDSEIAELRKIERFASLVVANINPKSFMSWQEGYEAGAVAERERIIAKNVPEIEKINTHIKALEEAVLAERAECAKLADKQLRNMAALMSNPPKSSAAWEIAIAIRARGNRT